MDPFPPIDEPAETRRLVALHALGLLDSDPDREFDAVAALAARLLDKPIAAVTFVDGDRVWCKAIEGLKADSEPRDISYCTWTITSDAPTVINDAFDEPRFALRQQAYGAGMLRFYAGAPLHAPNGERIGSVCVAAHDPATLDDAQLRSLEELAVVVDALIAARATAREALQVATLIDGQAAQLRRQERSLHQAQRIAMIGSWRMNLADDTLEFSDNVYRIYGLPEGTAMTIRRATEFYPPAARATLTAALAHAIATGTAFDIELDFVTAQGSSRRVRTVGEVEIEDGRAHALIGVFHDITDRHAIEQSLRSSADRDALTGIANRAAFDRTIDEAVAAARRDNTPLMLAMVDLDRFKGINDTLGHLAGDDVLREVARRLALPWLNGSFAARLGGDEFALLVDDPTLVAQPERFEQRLHDDLHIAAIADGMTIAASGSVGVALLDDGMTTVRDLIRSADERLYAAKRTRAGERRNDDRRHAMI